MCELMRRSLNSFASQPTCTVLRLSHTTAAGNIHVHGEDMTSANYSQPLLSRLPVMWFKGIDCAACGFCSITARSSAHYDLSRIHIVLLNLVTLHPQLSQTSIQWHFLFFFVPVTHLHCSVLEGWTLAEVRPPLLYSQPTYFIQAAESSSFCARPRGEKISTNGKNETPSVYVALAALI